MDERAKIPYKTAKPDPALFRYALESVSRRAIYSCNHNYHINERHPDRVMKEHDLIYIAEGEWEIWQDETAYTAKAGDVILLQAGRRHYGLQPCRGEVCTIFVHFSACEEDDLAESAQVSRERYVFPVLSSLPLSSQIPELMEKMVDAYWRNDIYAPVRAADYLSLVLCELSSLAAAGQADAGREELVGRLIQMMKMNPGRFYPVEELAEMIHVSKRTLHNYFYGVTGLSPHAFQLAMKLDAARQNMMSGGRRLKDVAAYYGFYDEYHFTRLYKARFGCAPKSE